MESNVHAGAPSIRPRITHTRQSSLRSSSEVSDESMSDEDTGTLDALSNDTGSWGQVPMQSTPRPRAQREIQDDSFLDRLMTGAKDVPKAPKRKRGRPRKEEAAFTFHPSSIQPQASVSASFPRRATQTTSSPVEDSTEQPKRKRGRPRKRELAPHEEIALIAFKQSGHIPPWTVIAPVDRPPQYPETHVYFRVPQTRRHPPSILDSPEAPKPQPSRWWHYKRPLLRGIPARRPDGQTPEPLPLAPPGRRPRTRVDYAALQHLQLANRARGAQLDVQALWQHRVSKEKARSTKAATTCDATTAA